MYALIPLLDRYIDLLQAFITNQLVLAPLLLLLLEEMGVPILVPGDAILAFAGYQVAQSHHAKLWVAFGLALISVLIGSTVLFFLSRRWGQLIIKKLGKFIFLEEKHIDQAERLFNRFGFWTIIFGRHIPGMRVPITIFAATSNVKYPVFIVSTIFSTVFWILFYLTVGKHFSNDIGAVIHRGAWLTVGLILGLVAVILALHIIGARRHKTND